MNYLRQYGCKTALSYELLATVLMEMRCAISTNGLLATVLMQSKHLFRHMNYLLPSREELKLDAALQWHFFVRMVG